MNNKSWRVSRRQLIKGGGAALALPLLNGMRSNSGMTWAQDSEHGKLPKVKDRHGNQKKSDEWRGF